MTGATQVKPRGPRIRAGQTWFVVLPTGLSCSCVSIEEVTHKTVVFRPEADLGRSTFGLATRYPRADVRFVERVP